MSSDSFRAKMSLSNSGPRDAVASKARLRAGCHRTGSGGAGRLARGVRRRLRRRRGRRARRDGRRPAGRRERGHEDDEEDAPAVPHVVHHERMMTPLGRACRGARDARPRRRRPAATPSCAGLVASATWRPRTPSSGPRPPPTRRPSAGSSRDARLNPRDLDWRRFLVADDRWRGRRLRAGARPPRREPGAGVRGGRPGPPGSGLGRAISEATIAREPARPLYLYTQSLTVPFWERLGFGLIDGPDVPPDMRGSLRIARVATAVYSLLVRRRVRIEVMRRDEA